MFFLLLFPLAVEAIHFAIVKETAFIRAKQLSGGRGIINVGCGPHRTVWAQKVSEDPEVVANIDVVPDGVPNFLHLDLETDPLPFKDKQFGCAFASHTLEHLDNWEFALNEMMRVADYVVIVLPNPRSIGGWLSPEHRQHFPLADMETLAQLYPNLVVYC